VRENGAKQQQGEEKAMAKWVPEVLVIFGSLLGGTSLFLSGRPGTKVPVSEPMPAESSTAKDCGAIALYLICRISH